MAVIRTLNLQSQQRIDVPHLRSIESAVAGDFDVLAGRIVGGQKALVVRGFEVSGIASNGQATALQVSVANGILLNLNATESGSMLWVPSNRAIEALNPLTNARVTGGWIQSATNYVGMDYTREADASTTDLVQFGDPLTNRETPKQIPLAQTLDYVIQISTIPFSAQPNIIPLAIVTLDSAAQVTAIQDARPMMFRLGSGGDNPQSQSFFTGWTRKETSGVIDNTIFVGGDKPIQSLKDWQDAVMSRLWELGGGGNWYSPTADRNVKMYGIPGGGNVFASNGQNFEIVANNLHWKNLVLQFDNANTGGVYYNTVAGQTVDLAGLTNLAVGECVYVDLDRTQNATNIPVTKVAMQAMGQPAVPGGRYIIAWRTTDAGTMTVYTRDNPYQVGNTIQAATTSAVGGVRLAETPASAGTPTVITIGTNNVTKIGYSYPATGVNPALDVVGGATAGSFGAVINAGGANNTALKLVKTGTGAALDAASGKLINVADPVAVQDAATKNYVDSSDTATALLATNALAAKVTQNYVINSGFDFWQRTGAGGGLLALNTNSSTRSYFADRWALYITRGAGTGSDVLVLSTSRQTNTATTSSRYAGRYSLTAVPTAGVPWSASMSQEIDRNWVRQMRGKKIRLSFKAVADASWATSASSQNLRYEVVIGTGAETEIVSGPYTGSSTAIQIDGAFSGTSSVDVVSAAVIPTNTTTMSIRFYTDSVLNSGAVAGQYLDISEVHLIAGTAINAPVAQSWVSAASSKQAELSLCQRYYEKSSEVETAPSSGTALGAHYASVAAILTPDVTGIWVLGYQPRFLIPKNTIPAIALWDTAGGAGTWIIGGTVRLCSSTNTSTAGFVLTNSTGGPITPTAGFAIGHWSADAEI